jgi:hypothetical protein
MPHYHPAEQGKEPPAFCGSTSGELVLSLFPDYLCDNYHDHRDTAADYKKPQHPSPHYIKGGSRIIQSHLVHLYFSRTFPKPTGF